MNQAQHIRRGFSLIELVIVVVIIGIIAAIAIPRLSRGATGAADSALSANLNILRSAIDLYAAEHNNTFPAVATFETQLTQYSDAAGTNFSPAKNGISGIVYGPYLRKIPTLSVGSVPSKGSATVIDGSSGTPGTATGAWFYNATTGEIKSNTPDSGIDATTKAWNTY